MKKYNNTKTIIAVSNKPAILVYVIAALMICTGAIYFIVASEDYSELLQSASPSSPGSSTTTESKNSGDTIATVNEMIFFTVVGVAYTAAGIWMLENKYYSKVPIYSCHRLNSAYRILYIYKDNEYSFYRNTRRCRYNRYTFQGDASSYSWYIGVHCKVFNNNMEKCYNNKSTIISIPTISRRNIRI